MAPAKKSLFQSVCSGTSCPESTYGAHSSSGKCHKPGRVTRNPFLNFLRQFRQEQCGLTIIQIAVQGAEKWRCMSDDQKMPFVREACSAPKYVKKLKSKRGKIFKGSRRK